MPGLNNIFVGQEFKSLQQLSLTLTGEKLPKGKGRSLRLNKFHKYLNWKSIPGTHKIVITEIFPESLEPQKNIKAPKIKPIVQGKYNKLILANLSYLQLNKPYKIKDIYSAIGFCSPRYLDPKQYLSICNELNLSLPSYKILRNQINFMLYQLLFPNLKKFKQKNCIDYYEDYLFDFFSEPTPIPKGTVEQIKSEALKHFESNNEWALIRSSQSSNYKEYVLERLSPYNVKNYHKAYVFTKIDVPDYLVPDKEQLLNLIYTKFYKFYNKSDQHNYFSQITSLLRILTSL